MGMSAKQTQSRVQQTAVSVTIETTKQDEDGREDPGAGGEHGHGTQEGSPGGGPGAGRGARGKGLKAKCRRGSREESKRRVRETR